MDPKERFEQKNWGRWGAQDAKGLLNLLSPENTVAASRLVKTGRVYPLAIPMSAELSSPLRRSFEHSISVRHADRKANYES